MTAASTFLDVIRDRLGVGPASVVADGRVHRFPTRPGGRDDAGWYVFHDDEMPAGSFGCWRSGLSETWFARSTASMSPVERMTQRERARLLAQARDADLAQRHAEGAAKAADVWAQASPAQSDHPYLIRKNVAAYGLRQAGECLVVPLRIKGEVASVQYIGPDGSKRFMRGGAVAGGYHSFGRVNDDVVVVEGYATGASIHAATGHAVAVAFNSGNLKPVALALRKKLPDLRIIIAGDDDFQSAGNPGATAARAAAAAVGGTTAFPPFDRTAGEIGTDWNDYAIGKDGATVLKAFEGAVDAADSRAVRPVVLDAHDLVQREFPPRKLLLSPWLPERGLAMIVAARGIGKTWTALNVAVAVGTGGSFLGWTAPAERRVLYLDGEMPASALQERFMTILAGTERDMSPENFRLLAADLQEQGIPSLASAEGRAFLDHEARAADLIILDNIATLCGTGDENVSDSWRPVQEWALRQRSAGRSVLFVHHAGKNGGQRGTSAREDVLDSVVNLTRPFDYEASQGARFEVHYGKSRGFFGSDAEPFEARFDGTAWATMPVQRGDDGEALKAMQKAGMSVRDIAERTGLSKSSVARRIKEAGDDE